MVKNLFEKIISSMNHEEINSINNEFYIENNDINELKEIIYHLRSNFENLTQEYQTLKQENDQLQKQVSLLTQEIVDLKRKLNIDSSNSNLPPSSDMFTKKKIHNNRAQSDKKSGGQPGHKGSNLKFETIPENINETIDIKPVNCSNCNIELTEFNHVDTRQVHDIKIVKTITNYYIYEGVCSCGCVEKVETNRQLPSHGVSYGVNYKAIITYLFNQNFIPIDRLATLSADVLNIPISESTILNFQNSLAENLAINFNNKLYENIISSDVIHSDESGFNINGDNYWVHVYCNNENTLYYCHPNRGHKAMDEIGILNKIKGCLVTDAYTSYQKYTNVSMHGFCNAHLLRELKSLEDYKLSWPNQLRILLLEMNTASKNDSMNKELEIKLTQDYDNIIKLANSELDNIKNNDKEFKKVKSILKRLSTKKNNYLAFLSHPEIPFTNNQAERDVRMIKLKNKISGGFRTEKGADNFLMIRSFISTMRKKGLNLIEAVRKIIDDPGDFTFHNE